MGVANIDARHAGLSWVLCIVGPHDGAFHRFGGPVDRRRTAFVVLDCRGVDDLRLRFPQHEIPDLPLSQGVHRVGRDHEGRPGHVDEAAPSAVRFCVDQRGVWLQAGDYGSGLHVNGRPVRRMAMLRAGDCVYLNGLEMLLLGAEPFPAPTEDFPARPNDRRTVLRGVGGFYHGHCISLHERITVGRSPDCAIHIDDAMLPARHATLEPHAEGAVLRDLGSGNGSVVNGHRVRDALLRAGDQVVFSSQLRFVMEAPSRVSRGALAVPQDEGYPEAGDEGVRSPLPASVRRVPWLLLAALLLAGVLSLLLLYGAR
ncbi:MAG: FHA domain-containing protein [Lysobacter sp.]|nr:FHA domain-containing protein [Lysobacter sp.]